MHFRDRIKERTRNFSPGVCVCIYILGMLFACEINLPVYESKWIREQKSIELRNVYSMSILLVMMTRT